MTIKRNVPFYKTLFLFFSLVPLFSVAQSHIPDSETLVNLVQIPAEERFAKTQFQFDAIAKTNQLLASIKTALLRKQVSKSTDLVLTRDCLAWDLLTTAGPTNVTALAKEGVKYAKFLNTFLSDIHWMTLYSGNGIAPRDTAIGLRILADIWARDRRSADFRDYLNLATGIAAAWSAGPQSEHLQYAQTLPPGFGHCDPVWRYFFFKSSQKKGVLAQNFLQLRPWEIRFVAGGQWDDTSLAWLQQRINLPPERWGDACWTAPYIGTSEFGDTIQGPLFYAGSAQSLCAAERTLRHGAVCGGLSTAGATAASAHGFLAYTCGQPGHCAYAFRLKRGDWRGGFGGPDGSPHNWIYPGRAPAVVRLMEAAFADDTLVDTRTQLIAEARAAEAIGEIKAAGRLWNILLRNHPFELSMQHEFQQFVIRNHFFPERKWPSYGEYLLKALRGHGFGFLEVIKPVQDRIINTLSSSEKVGWLLKVQQTLQDTPPSWANDMEKIIENQARYCPDEEQAKSRFLTGVLAIHLNGTNHQASAAALEWAVQSYVAKGEETLFAKAIQSVTQQIPEKLSVRPEKEKREMQKYFHKAILETEKAQARNAFSAIQAYVQKMGLAEGYEPAEKFRLPPQKHPLLRNALLLLSTSSHWDKPCAHQKVFLPEDGAFHTDAEDRPSVRISYPNPVRLHSFTLVKKRGWESRSKHLQLFTSDNGTEWKPLVEETNTPNIWTVTLPHPVQTRWIKIEQQNNGKKECFHLRNILLFGEEGAGK